jgi:hypothetical protein
MNQNQRKIIAQQVIDEPVLQEFTTQVDQALADGWQPLGDVRQIHIPEGKWKETCYYYQTWVKYEPDPLVETLEEFNARVMRDSEELKEDFLTEAINKQKENKNE